MTMQHQHASSATGLHFLAQSGLRAQFESPHSPLGGLRPGLDRVDFVEDADLTAPGIALDLPVLMPVTSEFQAEGLRDVRVRHPLALLVAVTNDVSGHQTYYAIRSGANFVLNLAIPGDRQIDMLYAQCRAHCVAGAVDGSAAWLRSVPGEHGGHHGADDSGPAFRESFLAPRGPSSHGLRGPAPALADTVARARSALDPPSGPARGATPDPASAPEQPRNPQPSRNPQPPQTPQSPQPPHHPSAPHRPPPALPDCDRELLHSLCTSATVSEIARRHYCSERSMYRRIRRLYDDLGVTGRAELLSLAAGWGPADRVPARAG
ncbi:hypothetical protein AB0D04_25775 [Streptomyces sp. NPDC048483]|uniref:helix-turn-helix transcriptional regulator n=1 Tax=Streptomyces sp. NPDC048483 TaxID=3154927 RepID=UPI0034374DBE